MDEAFESAWDSYHQAVLAVVSRRTRQYLSYDEQVQLARIAVFEAVRHKENPPQEYVLRCVLQVAVQVLESEGYLRRVGKRGSGGRQPVTRPLSLDVPPSDDADTDMRDLLPSITNVQVQAEVWCALRGLTDWQRLAVVGREVFDLSWTHIAQCLGVTRKTVVRAHEQGMRALRYLLVA